MERHQTLRHAVRQGSDHLLGDDERRVLEAAAVFAGGFDASAAEEACGSDDLDRYAVLDAVDSLVRKSMFVVDRLDGRRPVRDAGDDPPVRRRAAPVGGRGERGSGSPRLVVRAASRQSRRAVRRTGAGSRRGVAGTGVRQPPSRVPHRVESEDLNVAGPIATFVALAGSFAWQRWEGVAWAEELVPLARSKRWRRLPLLLAGAAACGSLEGRSADGVRYGEEAVVLGDDPAFERDRGAASR